MTTATRDSQSKKRSKFSYAVHVTQIEFDSLSLNLLWHLICNDNEIKMIELYQSPLALDNKLNCARISYININIVCLLSFAYCLFS